MQSNIMLLIIVVKYMYMFSGFAVDLWQTFEVDSLEHLEALEMVTARLENQVNRCKANIMLVTSFDASPKRRQIKRNWPSTDYKGLIEI